MEFSRRRDRRSGGFGRLARLVGWIVLLLLTARSGGLAEDSDPLARELLGLFAEEQALAPDRLWVVEHKLENWFQRAGPRAVDLLRAHREQAGERARHWMDERIELADRVQEARRLLRGYEALRLPDVRGKAFVRLPDDLPRGWRDLALDRLRPRAGWVVRQTESAVVILDAEMDVHILPRGRFHPLDFSEACAERIASGARSVHFNPFMEQIDIGRMAWWALQQGMERTAVELTDLLRSGPAAERLVLEQRHRAPPGEVPLDQWITRGLARALRIKAVRAAGHGENRDRLASRWVRLALLPEHPWSREAAEMALLLARQAEAEFAEPRRPDGEIRSWATGVQVEFWISRLRELNEGPDPIEGWHNRQFITAQLRLMDDPPPIGPMMELSRLDWDAVPALIAQFDNRQPTRTIVPDDAPDTDGGYIWRVGDFCRELVAAISGMRFGARRTPLGWGLGRDPPTDWDRDLRPVAEAWWREARSRTPEERYWMALDRDPDQAARDLLSLETGRRKAHVQRAMGGLDAEKRQRVQRRIDAFRGGTSARILATAVRSNDPRTVARAALGLWETAGTDEGGIALLERLRAVGTPAQYGKLWDPRSPDVREAVQALAQIGTDRCVAALVELLAHSDRGIRVLAMEAAAPIRKEEIARGFFQLLGDKSPVDPNQSGPEIERICDRAARHLAPMIRFSEPAVSGGTPAERDLAIARLKAWWLQLYSSPPSKGEDGGDPSR